MKIELCSYSGYKIYPGHGKRIVKVDGRVFQFLNSKCEASHMMKRNLAAKEKQKAKDAQKKQQKAQASRTAQPKMKPSQKGGAATKPRVGGKR
ncbi:large ribosomal subunit protein eL24-like [Saccostrea cucullata]|uniref:large ribosomal subunit protein eL24-like n=1 Tax=Saccostrea cuccullata TaxID=36930 RepID=UPI002ED52B4B